jgi:hypothetical protein
MYRSPHLEDTVGYPVLGGRTAWIEKEDQNGYGRLRIY